jgi:molecular chaperone DnaK (HSP70)
VKKKKLRTEVPVKATTAGMSSAALAAAVENEFSMALQDKVMEETKEKKNAVEEYVYSMRNKLYDSLVRACSFSRHASHTVCDAWVACTRYDGAV